jgi:hypothetical protein
VSIDTIQPKAYSYFCPLLWGCQHCVSHRFFHAHRRRHRRRSRSRSGGSRKRRRRSASRTRTLSRAGGDLRTLSRGRERPPRRRARGGRKRKRGGRDRNRGGRRGPEVSTRKLEDLKEENKVGTEIFPYFFSVDILKKIFATLNRNTLHKKRNLSTVPTVNGRLSMKIQFFLQLMFVF